MNQCEKVPYRSREKNALPLIINHGWPGSVLEQIKLSAMRTGPTGTLPTW